MKVTFLSIKPCWTVLCTVASSLALTGLTYGQSLQSNPSTWPTPPSLSLTGTPLLNQPSLVISNDSGLPTKADRSYRYTFQELGARYPFRLRGIDGSDGVFFNVRADELVTRAEIDLSYSFSPAMLSDYSHINVLVNDEIAFSIPVPRDEAGRTLQRNISIPPHLFTEFNQLRFQLIGHYTLECEDPLHSSLWASISNKSTISLHVQKIPTVNDLSRLPLPFFDHRGNGTLTLPIVFLNDRGETTLESAGMIASWFGLLAKNRGAQFPTHLDGSYPKKGHAVVLVKADASASFPAVSGPTIAITANPNDADGKLLWIMGRNAEEIKQAAQSLVTGATTLTGQVATIRQVKQRDPRQPYDAPYWTRTDRPVKFGELLPESKLNSIGYQGGPVRLDLRPPPDLFGWREKPVPVDLRYRYTVQQGRTDSSLIVSADKNFIRSFALHSADAIKDESRIIKQDSRSTLPVDVAMDIPLDTLMTESEIEFRFMFDYVKEGVCRDFIIDNVRGRIDPDSTIDFSGYPHFMPLPDLKAFGKSGFPFTRLADLSETTVVLASQPSAEDLSTYLTLMGRFGKSTGYPGTHITVGLGEKKLTVKNKDVIIISSTDQRWLDGWANHIPAMVAGDRKRMGTSDLVFNSVDWRTPDPRQSQSPIRTELSYDSTGDVAIIAGFESPVESGRSVVLIASSQPQGQDLVAKALLNLNDFENNLMGSLAVVHQNGISPLAAQYSYFIGNLGFWKSIEWKLASYWSGLFSFWWIGTPLLLLIVWLLVAISRRVRRLKIGSQGRERADNH